MPPLADAGRLRGDDDEGCSWQARRRTCALWRDGCDDDHAADFAVRAQVKVEAGHAKAEGFDGFGFTR